MTKFVTRNLGWKLASLATAFLLWMTLSGSHETTMSVSAPVQYSNIPKNLEISSGMIQEAHLILRGPSLKLARVRNGNIPLNLDLATMRGPGERTYTITQSNLELPTGVRLERAVPSQIRLTLETRAMKSVPVNVRLEHIPEGMIIEQQSVVPPSLTLLGPESNIRDIRFVETDPVDLRTLNAQGEARTTAYARDPKVIFDGSRVVTVKVVLKPAQPPAPTP